MKALSNLKVLDFTTLLPGPYATMMLADLGAEVLKISSPSKPDLILDHEPYVAGTNIGANELWLGRNKKNIFLNLKHPEAIKIIKALVKEYDIVIEQFRAGVMDKLGLGYEELKKENPRLIYCSLTGYGQTGPRAKSAGHDNNFVALSGNLAMLGYKETGPAPMNLQLGDICSGSSNAVISILAAVNQRAMTGEGQYIWYENPKKNIPLAIFSHRVIICPSMPTIDSGKPPILFGDFKHFVIGDRKHRRIKRLTEVHAQQGQVAYIMSQRVDAKLLDRNAVASLKVK